MGNSSQGKKKNMQLISKLWAVALIVIAGAIVNDVFFGGPLDSLIIKPAMKKLKKNIEPKELQNIIQDPRPVEYVEDAEFESASPVKKTSRSKTELKQEIISQCSQLTKKLKDSSLPDRYVSIDLNFHEPSLRKNPIFNDLKYCFFEDETSKFRLEMDIFSSGFGGRAEDQVQVQVSAFELDSSNKIFETGFQFHLSLPATK